MQALTKRLGQENVAILPAKAGKKVVVYTPPAERGRGKTVQGRGKNGVSVGFRRGKGVVMFILVRQVRLRARLDLAAAQKQADAAPETEMARAVVR